MMGFAAALPILQVFYRSQASAHRYKTAEAVLLQADYLTVCSDAERGNDKKAFTTVFCQPS